MTDDLELRDLDRMRARGAVRAVLVVYLAELAWSLLAAWPIRVHASRSFGAHPDGDAVLFAPGARALLEWVGDDSGGVLVSALPVTVATLLVGALVMQLPLGALLLRLTHTRGGIPPRAGEGAAFARRAFMPLVAIALSSLVLEGAILGGGVAAAGALYDRLAPRGDARAVVYAMTAVVPFLLLVAAVGVTADLARAAVVVRERENLGNASALRTALRALRHAFSGMRRAWALAIGAWASRWAAGLALVVCGAVAAAYLGGKAGAALVALWVAHQIVLLGRTALRASWLARAARIVAP
ncbi:MAG: hypothetical protein KC657_19090 [Myxococcales bacterium]|nr:hypothetical protein [Myxococcales bacterium]